jgi:hypothetical protein
MRHAIWPAAAAALLIGTASASAYEQDTHYGLTYYLARQVGFIRQNAHKVADYAWSIDVNEETEPAPVPWWGIKQIPLVSTAQIIGQLQLRPTQVDVLKSFHAFPSELPPSCDKSDSVDNVVNLTKFSQIDNRESYLQSQAGELRNPGVFLHYFEDSYSHTGFTCGSRGQGHAQDVHAPDYLSRKPKIAQQMATDVSQKLSDFLASSKLGAPCTPDADQIQRMVQKLIGVNPADTRADTVPFWVLGLLGDWALGSGPDYEKAKPILDSGLPKGEPVPEFSMQQIVAKPNGNGYLDAVPVGNGQPVQDQNGSIFLANEAWRTADKAQKRVYFSIDASTTDPNAISFRDKHNWEFDSYDPKADSWEFSRTPSPDEMPKNPPPTFSSQDPADWTWAKAQVQSKLKLHLVLTLAHPSCKIQGQYYRGFWRFQVDPKTGDKRAWIPDGRASWGSPVSYNLERDFQKVQ